MEKLKIIRLKLSEVILDPRNARIHGTRDIEDKKAMLLKFGQQKPFVVSSDNVVRAGNGFVMAAREIGWEEADFVVTNLTEMEAIAFGIADNRAG